MDNDEDRKGFIAKGSEWVLNARLADARFFFEEDAKETLEARLPQLARLTFQDKLGDYRQKTARIQELARGDRARRSGAPDLVEAVAHGGPALQGRPDDATSSRSSRISRASSAGIYARRERYPDSVWKADLRPVPPGLGLRRSAARGLRRDPLARRPVRLALPVSSASASSRPARRTPTACAARRSASSRSRSRATGAPTGGPIVRKAMSLYPPGLAGARARRDRRGARATSSRSACGACSSGAATSYDEISAVLNVGVWDFADAADRARALSEARRHMDFRSLILAFKRIRNIVGDEQPGAPSPELYREDGRADAGGATSCRRSRRSRASSAERHYREAMETIASIAPSLDRFFVDVLVNCPEEDLRRNRLALLASIQQEFSRLADFSEIVVRRKMKRVFSFGNGVAEGAGLGKETLGRQGRGPGRDDGPRDPGAAGVHDRDLGLRRLLARRLARRRSGPRSSRRSLKLEHDADKRFGDPQNPLLVSVRSGARSSMPGHDGHDPEPGPDLPHREGPRRAARASASRSTAAADSSRCTATSCCASRGTSSRRR